MVARDGFRMVDCIHIQRTCRLGMSIQHEHAHVSQHHANTCKDRDLEQNVGARGHAKERRAQALQYVL